MMNQNKKSMKTKLGAAVRRISKTLTDNKDYRSWCYAGCMSSIAPNMRTW